MYAPYSRREPEEPEDATKGRDIFNEKPPPDELLAVSDIGNSVTTSLPDNVVSFLFIHLFLWGNHGQFVLSLAQTFSSPS